MEAGGFEPPSRDISDQASTCLVAFLKFAQKNAKRQAFIFAISQSFSHLRHENPQTLSRFLTPLIGPQENAYQDGPLN